MAHIYSLVIVEINRDGNVLLLIDLPNLNNFINHRQICLLHIIFFMNMSCFTSCVINLVKFFATTNPILSQRITATIITRRRSGSLKNTVQMGEMMVAVRGRKLQSDDIIFNLQSLITLMNNFFSSSRCSRSSFNSISTAVEILEGGEVCHMQTRMLPLM